MKEKTADQNDPVLVYWKLNPLCDANTCKYCVYYAEEDGKCTQWSRQKWCILHSPRIFQFWINEKDLTL